MSLLLLTALLFMSLLILLTASGAQLGDEGFCIEDASSEGFERRTARPEGL